MIILSTVENSKRGAEEDAQEMQYRWAANEWSTARSQFMESLGHRVSRWEGRVRNGAGGVDGRRGFEGGRFADNSVFGNEYSAGYPTPGGAEDSFNGASSVALEQLHGGGSMQATPAKGGGAGGAVPPFNTPGSALNGAASQARLDYSTAKANISEFARQHADTVRRLNLSVRQQQHSSSSSSTSSTATVRPFLEFQRSAENNLHIGSSKATKISDGMTVGDMQGYTAVLGLLASCVGEGRSDVHVPPSYFSSICFDQSDVYVDVAEKKRAFLTDGAKTFFENQIWNDVWLLSVEQAVERGEIMLPPAQHGGTRRQQLRTYVSLQYRIGAIPEHCGGLRCVLDASAASGHSSSRGGGGGGPERALPSPPLWACVYHHMRAGDLASAVEELNAILGGGGGGSGGRGAGGAILQQAAAAAKLLLRACGSSCARTLPKDITAASSSSSSANLLASSRASADDLTAADLQELYAIMGRVREEFARESLLEENAAEAGTVNTNVDPYRTHVLNLLGLANREALAYSAIPGLGIEDFLWGQLWFVSLSRTLRSIGDAVHRDAGAGGGAVGGGGLNSIMPQQHFFLKQIAAAENHLFELVQSYGGPDHFDAERENAFQYATVLICCQRFGDAVSYLWRTSHQSFAAAHLLVACLHYGLVQPQVPLTHNPPHASLIAAQRRAGISLGTHGGESQAEVSPASLLRTFISSHGYTRRADLAADYIVSIDPSPQWVSHVQGMDQARIDALKLKSQSLTASALDAFIYSLSREQLIRVVGAPLINGSELSSLATPYAHTKGAGASAVSQWRTRGHLDEYIAPVQVELLLSRCALNTLTQRRDAECAVFLYQLAGKYSEVLHEMCNQLADHLMTTAAESAQAAASENNNNTGAGSSRSVRSMWYELCADFGHRFLQSDCLVLRSVQSAGAQVLVDTFFALLRLYAYVDLCCDGVTCTTPDGCEHTLGTLDALDWFPTQVARVSQYSCPSASALKAVQDDVLLLTMNCTYHAYMLLKSHIKRTAATYGSTPVAAGGGAGTGVLTSVEQRSLALKERARALVMYAQQIRSSLNRVDTVTALAGAETSFI